jgi:uncharacterized damage-inducible protein DinB
MPQLNEPVLNEMREESATTRRVLARVPADKLTWKPHPKSITLGQLAYHIALLPSGIPRILEHDHFELPPTAFTFVQPKDTAEILAIFDDGVKTGDAFVAGLTDDKWHATWHMSANGKQIIARPRGEMVRQLMMSHLYHHRGQLCVYLRMLGVPVPSVYGPSADESPFA